MSNVQKVMIILLTVSGLLLLSLRLPSLAADVPSKSVPQVVLKQPAVLPGESVRLVARASVTFADVDGALDAPSLYNLMLAARLMNGVTLGPGEVFSFNQAVGPRTPATGFKMGISVVDGHFVPDVGGGVCGASTVLFQAVERAGLPVVERHTHAIPVSYVAPGLDAAVWYGVEDFRFRNTLADDLRIATYEAGDTLTVALWEVEEGPSE